MAGAGMRQPWQPECRDCSFPGPIDGSSAWGRAQPRRAATLGSNHPVGRKTTAQAPRRSARRPSISSAARLPGGGPDRRPARRWCQNPGPNADSRSSFRRGIRSLEAGPHIDRKQPSWGLRWLFRSRRKPRRRPRLSPGRRRTKRTSAGKAASRRRPAAVRFGAKGRPGACQTALPSQRSSAWCHHTPWREARAGG